MLLARMPTMPTLVDDFVIDSDSESDDDTLPKTPTTPTTLPPMFAQPHKSIILTAPNHRPIAGSKRVLRFRETHGSHISREGGEVLQSITASPALGHQSFEELRIDCYMQSRLATGSSPKAVDPENAPWAIIPPAYNPFLVKSTLQSRCENESEDVIMSD